MDINTFIKELESLNIYPTQKQIDQLETYYKLIIDWNKKINLTRITEKEDVYLKHFYDSITISKVIDLNNKATLLDFGTGAGFPGIVLKIIYPNLNITLVDSLQKRVNFLNTVINSLQFKDIKALHERVENLEVKHYDIITTRAVANLSKLLQYTNKLIDTKTLFIPLKANIEDELKQAKNEFVKYHLELVKQDTFFLHIEHSIRNILVIKKKS